MWLIHVVAGTWAFPLVLVMAAPVAPYSRLGPWFLAVAGLLLLLLDFLLSCLLSALITASCRTRLNSGGLQNYNFWGLRAETPWNQITAAGPAPRVLPLFIRIETHSARLAIWLPTYHVDQERLEREILTLAPVNSPLRPVLEKRRPSP
jgi:hypothetical protein